MNGGNDPATDEVAANAGTLHAALEAVLMVVEEPVPEEQLAAVVGLPTAQVRDALHELAREYDGYTRDGGTVPVRGFELRQLAGGWRVYSRPAYSGIVSQFVVDGQTARLTQAALETLAVIAYRQPVSRARVSAVRGVNVDSVVRTLAQRGLIEEVGTDPVSGAFLYRTTAYFLERLGIGSVEELPQIAQHLPGLENLHDYIDAQL
ncbi:segregation and condensation protein B [Arthrobacter silviterrae]|uniref:SMC-Scp complex subunit ScpB n=1 Tax=Arthrobacter silviterrae TaxID=2026658 RepID=A0ABX0D952_9MICC|nr:MULTISPECIES: SMC-Scp complex subunit ScpB [Arthrobacter]MCU6479139.1 SMC-Scp complex subunit ScpB [Arthrobacter sp. A2-55]MDQ0275726.1 segregation and condensation protein B [Arthrobacter silviterrae]NGN83176.1 SMC-Scp complex subunit ScpB [Arthrobacter silviterrae]